MEVSGIAHLTTWVTWGISWVSIIFGLILGAYVVFRNKVQGPGTARSKAESLLIKKSSRVYVKKLLALLSVVILPMSILIGLIFWSLTIGALVLVGAAASVAVGIFAMELATTANVKILIRTIKAVAQGKGIGPGFQLAFIAGASIGALTIGVVCLMLTSILLLSMQQVVANGAIAIIFVPALAAQLFANGLGLSWLALFVKYGGGIFTKIADVAADMIGKAEISLIFRHVVNLIEDSILNAATVADNVGDNVGEELGATDDSGDSYGGGAISSIVLAVAVGTALSTTLFHIPLAMMSAGMVASLIGMVIFIAYAGRIRENPTRALNWSVNIAGILYLVLSFVALRLINVHWGYWVITNFGMLAGVGIGLITNYWVSDESKPVQETAHMAKQGTALSILNGWVAGMKSSTLPAVLIGLTMVVAGILGALILGPQYWAFGVSLAAIGTLSLMPMIVACDAYGAMVDNAQGIGARSGASEEVMILLDQMDSAGNVVKAVTKAFTIVQGEISTASLLLAFMVERKITALQFETLDFLFFIACAMMGGAMIKYFNALAVKSVTNGAQKVAKRMIQEYIDRPEILQYVVPTDPDAELDKTKLPDHERCTAICTDYAQKGLIPAIILIFGSVAAIYFVFGDIGLVGFMIGAILIGGFEAKVLANAGGHYDNAKKYSTTPQFRAEVRAIYGGEIRADKDESGVYIFTPEQEAAFEDLMKRIKAALVHCDTVGDPWKDTAGPGNNGALANIGYLANLIARLNATPLVVIVTKALGL